jgi:hypothetical protein
VEDDVVLDPFCGCGTSIVVANKLSRRWISNYITRLAGNLITKPLPDHAGEAAPYIEGSSHAFSSSRFPCFPL